MTGRIRDVIQRGTEGSKPAASSVDVGVLFSESDTGSFERSTGSAWEPVGVIDIVTTKGDLIVGAGADTVLRVGVGADGLFLKAASAQASGVTWATAGGVGGGIDSGTAFPAGSTDALFHRTDLDMLFEYNVTSAHWRSVHQYIISLVPVSSFNNSVSATKATALSGVLGLAPTYDFWVDSFVWSSQVATTNNGSAYWDVKLTKYAATTQTTVIVASTGTTPDTAGDIVAHNDAVGTALGIGSDLLVVDLTKVSTPGNLSLWGAAVVGRIIAT